MTRGSFFENISITNLLIIINIAFFIIVYLLLFYNSSTLDFIALSPKTFLNNFYFWTLITSMFMHGGFAHLFVNMLSLMFIGNFIEKIVGRKRFFGIYLFSGLFAGLFFVFLSLILPDSSLFGTGFDVSAVGASGALFGIAGLMTVLTPNLPVYIMLIPIPIRSKYAIPGMLVLIAVLSAASGWPVGNAAHLGGLIAGIAYGFYLKNKFRRKAKAISLYFR